MLQDKLHVFFVARALNECLTWWIWDTCGALLKDESEKPVIMEKMLLYPKFIICGRIFPDCLYIWEYKSPRTAKFIRWIAAAKSLPLICQRYRNLGWKRWSGDLFLKSVEHVLKNTHTLRHAANKWNYQQVIARTWVGTKCNIFISNINTGKTKK